MPNFETLFWGFTVGDLLLAVGRYLLLVSATLLAIKNIAWLTRWNGRNRRVGRETRLAFETLFTVALVAIYARHLVGPDASRVLAEFGSAEAGAVAWSFAGILITLVLTRRDDRPPADAKGSVREHHHAHDLQEHHHEHEHRDRQE